MIKRICFFLVLFFATYTLLAQVSRAQQKYPSLLWEITGNGLSRPSYLFGTMHVSNKMVFHLSDSFYLALKSVDAVALELNPDVWQGQMVAMNKIKQDYSDYTQSPRSDFLTENSFRINKYNPELKSALSTEPAMVNSLLYRSYKSREDFEEDTFLDLYIYQTGKKLGKRGTGVEDYFESERLVMEAYADMAKEKKKKTLDLDGESMYNISEKTQDAYRRGDLDLLDSLHRIMDRSEAFTEKFLYKRNEIQAYSMDTIMKKSSLFVGVGAAHLPGKRGVIEILRGMGYTLRPIFMTDRDAAQKEEVDKMKVPVQFSTRVAEDGFYRVDMPGPLFNITDDSRRIDRRQYSDMSNGSYYVVTRVKTYSGFLGQDGAEVLKQVDSVLYENIPGKILSKKEISRNGYKGYDISNRTRRGDLQRYQVYITPFEILIFKMSGKENYVDGQEGERFFSSIQLGEATGGPVVFQPQQGGFTVKLPHQPSVYLNDNSGDRIDRWEYSALDQATGDAYMIFKKTVCNFRFLDEDSFDLKLIEESFRSPDYFEKQQSRTPGSVEGYPALTVKEKMKDGSIVTARYIIKGPDYYVLAVRSKNRKSDFSSFFNSFHFTPYRYTGHQQFTDTFMHFTVNTPVLPQLDTAYRSQVEKAKDDVSGAAVNNSFWPKMQNALFRSEATGEMVGLSIQEYPRYYYPKDKAKFWVDDLRKNIQRADLLVWKEDSIQAGGVTAHRFILRDTGSSRTITRMVLLKGNYTYHMASMGDTLTKSNDFIDRFYSSFVPGAGTGAGSTIYDNKIEDFFRDLFSSDSTTRVKARQSISNVYYGETAVPMIMDAIGRLKYADKDYFESKTKLIAELGYIRDTIRPSVVSNLRLLYRATADTSMFQNEVLMALARHKTKEAYQLLSELMLQDPPVFDNTYGYTSLFSHLDDSLELARQLFPSILQLASLDDYKDRVTGLLVKLVDSNMISAADYESYFPKLYFDAKIELKKLRNRDEKRMEKENRQDDETNTYSPYRYGSSYNTSKNSLDDFSVLLMPFYNSNPNVPLFFTRLLQSNDPAVRMNAAVALTKAGKPVADSIFEKLAAEDNYRGRLYNKLDKIGMTSFFPARYRNQRDMARSLMIGSRNYEKVDSIAFISKQVTGYANKKGQVYFFKYRIKKEDDWKIGVSGLQPLNDKEVSGDDKLVLLTDKKIKPDQPLEEQLQEYLKKMLFGLHKSGRNFYSNNSNEINRFIRAGEYNN